MFVFVRGTGRCGSKTLARLLGAHPAITRVPVHQCLPEELIDWSELHLAARCPDATPDAIAAGWRAYFEAYCRRLAGAAPVLLHKSTGNVHRLAALLEAWPDARVVYLVRHPLEAVAALVSVDLARYRGAYGYAATVANALRRWYNDVAAFLRSPACGHPRLRLVRFEDMVQAPDAFFARVHRFLGVDDTVRHELPGACGYDDEFVLDRQERRWIIDATRDVVERLGYDPDAWSEAVPVELAGRTGLHPERRLQAPPGALDGVELVRRALAEAAAEGHERVGLFGAGSLARLVCPHLGDDLPVRVVCLLDEQPGLAGGRIAGLPIEPPRRAGALSLDAVVPVTLVHEAAMIRRWQRLAPDVAVLPLCPPAAAPA